MSTLTLEYFLLIAGIGHFGILIASALTPFVLDWKNVLKPLSPFLYKLFWVYGGFIVLVIICMGILTLLNIKSMATGNTEARMIAGFIAVFWGARLLVQIFIFDVKEYLTNFWLKLGYHTLTAAFIYFTILYSLVAFGFNFWRQ